MIAVHSLLLCPGSAKVSQVKPVSNAPKALIIEPSKELAEQTLNVVKQFKKYVENPKVRYAWSAARVKQILLVKKKNNAEFLTLYAGFIALFRK